MEDPFSDLVKSLESLFQLETMRNGKYIYPAVQQLKTAMDNYNFQVKSTFTFLLKAIKAALPHIEKWRVNFDLIRKSIDELAKVNKYAEVNWPKLLSHSKVSAKFQFSALNHSIKEIALSTWITAKTGKSFFQMEPSELIQALLKNKGRHGFSQKLSIYLQKHPDFLFSLIMDSEKNFVKLCHSRLILYLTDQQIAKAIIKHIAAFVPDQVSPYEQVDQVVNTLNYILSNGRSVSTLLRNAEAKPILLNSIFFQLYQSKSYADRQTSPLYVSDVDQNAGIRADFK